MANVFLDSPVMLWTHRPDVVCCFTDKIRVPKARWLPSSPEVRFTKLNAVFGRRPFRCEFFLKTQTGSNGTPSLPASLRNTGIDDKAYEKSFPNGRLPRRF